MDGPRSTFVRAVIQEVPFIDTRLRARKWTGGKRMVRPRNYCASMPGRGERCHHRECPYWSAGVSSHCLRKERVEHHPSTGEGDLGEVAEVMKNLLAREEMGHDLR